MTFADLKIGEIFMLTTVDDNGRILYQSGPYKKKNSNTYIGLGRQVGLSVTMMHPEIWGITVVA